MKQADILYIGMSEGLDIRSKELSGYLIRFLSSHYQVHLLGDLFHESSSELRRSYDLILVQNSFSFVYYKKLLKRYVKCPVLFIATTLDLKSYVAPFENLFGILNMSGVPLSAWGIPEEIQLHLNYPVEKVANYYFYEQQPEFCRIVYCPTENSVQESDFKLLTFLQKTNALLTIVSDGYQCLKNALPPFVTIVPRNSWFSAYKKAHLVVASGFDAMCAMALCKPCVILGDYGLGGVVTPDNYNNLESISFRGRKGGYWGELVPLDLLEVEIRNILVSNQEESFLDIQKLVMSDYNKKYFEKRFLQEIKRIIDLSTLIKQRNKKYMLRVCLSSLFALEEMKGKQYLLRGMNCFGELDVEMVELLKQCAETVSVYDLIQRNGYDNEEASILWKNLYELWKEKLILFVP
ncbi:hypothetical protein [uncultured Parabacteroides sp.]|uniref:hypothetical protein n=1 Tax=uncultured Parabacteroides sp. TaxID=512312 RepID=UPI002599C155|nr:hypothetical protein [uncultured Parabacteroides sp.]